MPSCCSNGTQVEKSSTNSIWDQLFLNLKTDFYLKKTEHCKPNQNLSRYILDLTVCVRDHYAILYDLFIFWMLRGYLKI